ncbi:MAG: thrombospondin type 3 repeat-containing protein [Deltaproteobacteria bacterium]|nr:thrombospondin type 3 repeat-containing protein [Deltaproteobacteria bacterium]
MHRAPTRALGARGQLHRMGISVGGGYPGLTDDPPSVYPPVMLTLLLLLSAPAQGQGLQIHYQGFAGGVSVDASGVTTQDDFNNFTDGPDLVVEIPDGAVVEKIFAVVHAENKGWHVDPSPVNLVNIKGQGLGNDTRIAQEWRYNLHDITTTHGITESDSYRYTEWGDAELIDPDPLIPAQVAHGPKKGYGVAGTTLFVVYNHPTNSGRRHITIATDSLTYSTGPHTITGLPNAGGTMLFAPTIVMECASEQSNTIELGGVDITTVAGGRDDGHPNHGCSEGTYPSWHSLITSGSFGFSGDTPETDVWEGTDGDTLTAEPRGDGTASNGRLSDELYEVIYAGGGSLDLEMYGNNSSAMRAFAMVIEMDTDGDGIGDATDGDADNDGVDNEDDTDPYDPYVCEDADTAGADGCDDCTIGVDQFGTPELNLPDNTPDNDGPDNDGDGICNVGDPDDDGDGVLDEDDSDDDDRNVCRDSDGDTCDDCIDYSADDSTGETVDPSDDGPDGDSDGLCDAGDPCYDPDEDGYGTSGYDLSGCTGSATVADNCPDIANPTQANADSDSLGDACDTCTDSDGDGWGDPGHDISACTGSATVYDNCPSNANANQADADSDGTGDVCDTCEDGDGDGYADPGKPNSGCVGTGYDNCPDLANASQTDTDGDGQGDACDLDDDDDTILDTEEVAIFTDPLDQDTDGDNIAEWDEISDPAAPENTDGDADIDALDDDSDGDTVSDLDEAGDVNIATVPVDTDLDLTPDFRDLDSDDDGILDGTDNCRVVVNTEQENLDDDPYGDACDDDWDGDGVVNDEDNCPLVANPLQEDLEEDGIGDACSDSKVYFQGGACRGNVAGGPSTGWWVVLLLVPAIFRRRTGRG